MWTWDFKKTLNNFKKKVNHVKDLNAFKSLNAFNKLTTDKIKTNLSKLSKALMLPIALLPIAGIFLGVGGVIENQLKDSTSAWLDFARALKIIGEMPFANLSILFAISIAIAYTKDAGAAGLTAFIAVLIFNGFISVFIKQAPNIDTYNLLFHQHIPKSAISNTLSLQTLNTGVFSGVIIGAMTAFLFNRFYTTKLPSVIAFFNGVRFVPIIVLLVTPLLSIVFMLIWPYISAMFARIGNGLAKMPGGTDSLLFGIIERSLIPFGLHHVFYGPLWWSDIGGSWIIDGKSVGGDQTIGIASLASTTFKLQNAPFTIGRFQTGKFPFMMFGLPAAAVAMILRCPKENRKEAMGIYGSAAFTSFLTGITEPIEFTFLFVAPWLFYLVHVPLCGLSFMLMNVLNVRVIMTFSAGILDFIIYGIIPNFQHHVTNFWIIPIVGFGYATVYFSVFYFLIKHFDLNIPCRKTLGTLYTKQDYRAKSSASDKLEKNISLIEISHQIINGLGGADNIVSVDACISRLRLVVKDAVIIDKPFLETLGATAVVVLGGTTIQMIYGGQSETYKAAILNILKQDNVES